MGRPKKASLEPSKRLTDQGRESFLVNLALDIAEQQLLNGTASSQLISHFLKLGTQKYKLENERLRSDLKVAEAKIKDYENREDTKILLESALNAFKSYVGVSEEESNHEY